MNLDSRSFTPMLVPVTSPWEPSEGCSRETWDDELPWEDGEWSPLWAHWGEEDGVRMSDGF
ncbi:MAG: hypothetical protein VKP72_05645 [bacterium]|nr:hypothetical protein [bacterium]